VLEQVDTSVTAQMVLQYYLTSELLEGPARVTHELWLDGKRAALEDPANPFRGYGPLRIKVRDLPADERAALGDADDGADIYHPLYQPYDELDSDGRSKNAVPMVVLCNAMGDIVLPANSELAALESALEQFIEGSNTQLVGLLARIQHLGFTASEVRVGARGYGEGARDDMGLHGFLSRSVQELDVDALKPVAEWMLTQLRNPHRLAWTLGQIDGQRLAEGLSWQEFFAVPHFDFNKLGKETDVEQLTEAPECWPEVEQFFRERTSGVEQVFYQGAGEDGVLIIGFVVHDLSGATASEVGSAIAGLKSELGIQAEMGEIRGATTQRVLPSTCPTCQVPWAFCRNRRDHQYDARQAMARRI
jgi:hypothetical protein